MVKDEWMSAAMSDDMLVVELLMRLKQSQASSPLKSSVPHPPPSQPLPSPPTTTTTMFPLTWSVRLPRSRAIRCDAVSQRKQGDVSTRCSPTTPLSWSGGASTCATGDGASPCATGDGASPCATGDGVEESSRPSNNRSPPHARSKGVAANNELASATTASRRSRRKKTFVELKEEENSLLKERVHLKKELAKVRATFKEQRAKNDSLKRMKLELHVDAAKYVNADGSMIASSSQPHEIVASTSDNVPSMLPSQLTHHCNARSDSCDESKTNSNRDGFFLLPDLNSLPCEEDCGSETCYG